MSVIGRYFWNDIPLEIRYEPSKNALKHDYVAQY